MTNFRHVFVYCFYRRILPFPFASGSLTRRGYCDEIYTSERKGDEWWNPGRSSLQGEVERESGIGSPGGGGGAARSSGYSYCWCCCYCCSVLLLLLRLSYLLLLDGTAYTPLLATHASQPAPVTTATPDGTHVVYSVARR